MSISLKVVTELALLFAFALLVMTRGRRGVATPRYLVALGCLAVASLIPHVEGVRRHANGRVHIHPTEWYHYYLGTKYFAECGYYGLYEATTIAEYELAPTEFRPGETLRQLRHPAFDVSKGDLLRNHPAIVQRFTPQRWQTFREDYAYFQGFDLRNWGTSPPERDHGYNGTPLTTAVLGTLANQRLLSTEQFVSLAAWFDLILVLGLTLGVGRYFDWEAAFAFLLLWALNPLNDFAFTGGAYLRHAHFVALTLGLMLFARDRRTAGGVAMATATGFRILPGVFAAAISAHDLANPRRAERLRRNRRFYVGLALGAVIIALATWQVRLQGGENGWSVFAERIQRHAENWSPNRIGLPFLLGYRTANAIEGPPSSLVPARAPQWRESMRATFDERRPVYIGLIVAGVLVSLVFLRSVAIEEAPFIGLLWLFLLAVPSHYDYALLGILPVLFPTDRRVWLVFAALSVTLLGLESSDAVTVSPDRAYATYSAAVGAFLLAITLMKCNWSNFRGAFTPDPASTTAQQANPDGSDGQR